MDLNQVAEQCTEDSHTWFPDIHQKPLEWQPVDYEIDHHLKALAGEIGELLNKWKKYERGSISREEIMRQLPDEWADALTYLMNIPKLVGFDAEEEYIDKRQFNQRRFGASRSHTDLPSEPDPVPGFLLPFNGGASS